MNIVSDNQWLSFFIKTNQKYQIKFEKKIDLNLIKKIETRNFVNSYRLLNNTLI